MVGRLLFFHAPLGPILARGGGGTAVYVGSHSLVVQSGRRLVFCVGPKRGPAPQTMVVAPWPKPLSAGAAVSWTGPWLAVGPHRYWAAEAHPWRPAPPPRPVSQDEARERVRAVCRELAASAADTARAAAWLAGGVRPAGGPGLPGGFWAARLAGLLSWGPGRPFQEGALLGLVGLGPGSTPAGDDVVTGYVTAWSRHRAWRRHPALRRLRGRLRQAACRTSPVSGLFLRWALAGVTGRDGLDFVDALIGVGTWEPSARKALARLAGHGATSGWDFAAGAVLAVEAMGRWSGRMSGWPGAWPLEERGDEACGVRLLRSHNG